MIEPDVKLQIINEIKKRSDWTDTLPQKGDEEFAHYYLGFEFMGRVIILSEYYDRHTNLTNWHVWEDNKLRDATEFEEFFFAAGFNDGLRDEYDDEMFPLISRDADNNVFEGNSEFPTPKEAT